MDITPLAQQCLTYWGTATISSLACLSLLTACFLGLFLCASLTVNGCAAFTALQLLSEPHTGSLACLWDVGGCHISCVSLAVLAR